MALPSSSRGRVVPDRHDLVEACLGPVTFGAVLDYLDVAAECHRRRVEDVDGVSRPHGTISALAFPTLLRPGFSKKEEEKEKKNHV
jgi:hypothetical protein